MAAPVSRSLIIRHLRVVGDTHGWVHAHRHKWRSLLGRHPHNIRGSRSPGAPLLQADWASTAICCDILARHHRELVPRLHITWWKPWPDHHWALSVRSCSSNQHVFAPTNTCSPHFWNTREVQRVLLHRRSTECLPNLDLVPETHILPPAQPPTKPWESST